MVMKIFNIQLIILGLLMFGCDFLLEEPSRSVTGVIATLLKGNTASQDSIHITWNATKEASGYTIAYRTEMDSLDTRRSVDSSVTITTYTHSSFITKQGPLTYYVQAYGYSTDKDGRRKQWTGPWAMSNQIELNE